MNIGSHILVDILTEKGYINSPSKRVSKVYFSHKMEAKDNYYYYWVDISLAERESYAYIHIS